MPFPPVFYSRRGVVCNSLYGTSPHPTSQFCVLMQEEGITVRWFSVVKNRLEYGVKLLIPFFLPAFHRRRGVVCNGLYGTPPLPVMRLNVRGGGHHPVIQRALCEELWWFIVVFQPSIEEGACRVKTCWGACLLTQAVLHSIRKMVNIV